MELERQAFLEEGEEGGNKGNGFYQRNLETQFGKVNNLEVPRDREGNFSPALFDPYQRRVGQLESMVIKMYSHGMPTRKIADLLEDMYGDHYSSSTVSRITDLALEEVKNPAPRDGACRKAFLSSFFRSFTNKDPAVNRPALNSELVL